MEYCRIILTILLHGAIWIRIINGNPVNTQQTGRASNSSQKKVIDVVSLELNLDLTLDEYHPPTQGRIISINTTNNKQSNDNKSQHDIVKAKQAHISEARDSSENDDDFTKETPACPPGFVRHKNSCYHIIGLSELTWAIANTYCQLHGSKLAEIESDSEQRFIETLITANRDAGEAYWIGATNRLGKGKWRWESNSEPLYYSMWVTQWSGWVGEIESPSCALIDKSESNQWMFWPCDKNFFMTGARHTKSTGIGLICEKESPRSTRKTRHMKSKRRRRQRKKGRRNWHKRHWKRFI